MRIVSRWITCPFVAAVILTWTGYTSAHENSTKKRATETYFAGLARLATQDIGELEHRLDSLDCQRIDEECEDGVAILRMLFDPVYRENLPDFLIYLYEENGVLRSKQPALIYRGKSTPFLFGADHVWAVVISRTKYSLEARLTTVFEQRTSTFFGLLSLLGFSGDPSKKDSPKSSTKPVAWERLSFSTEQDTAWYIGIARLEVPPTSVNRLTVSFRQPEYDLKIETKTTRPKTTTTGTDVTTNTEKRTETRDKTGELKDVKQETTSESKKTRSTPVHDAKITEGEVETTTMTMKGPDPNRPESPSSTVHSFSGHFSNSKKSMTAFSIGLAATLNTENTALGEDDGDTHYNGYALGKFYLRRPRLRAVAGRDGFSNRPSLGFVVGTNVADDIFDQIVVGFSIGHIWGTTGIFMGANSVPSKKPAVDDDDRRWRAVVGFDYTF